MKSFRLKLINEIRTFSKDKDKETSRMYFEAVSVGVAFALEEKPNLKLTKKIDPQKDLFNDFTFKSQINTSYRTHATHSIIKRINFIKEKLLIST